MNKKKIISAMLTVAMLASSAVSALAAEGKAAAQPRSAITQNPPPKHKN